MDFIFIPVREWGLARAQEIHFNQSGYELLNLETLKLIPLNWVLISLAYEAREAINKWKPVVIVKNSAKRNDKRINKEIWHREKHSLDILETDVTTNEDNASYPITKAKLGTGNVAFSRPSHVPCDKSIGRVSPI